MPDAKVTAQTRMMSCETTSDIDQPLSVIFEVADAQSAAVMMITSFLDDASCTNRKGIRGAPVGASVTSVTSSAPQIASSAQRKPIECRVSSLEGTDQSASVFIHKMSQKSLAWTSQVLEHQFEAGNRLQADFQKQQLQPTDTERSVSPSSAATSEKQTLSVE